MHSAQECRRQAEALVALALMFPDKAEAYRDAERRWRELEAQAIEGHPTSPRPADRHRADKPDDGEPRPRRP